MYKVTKYCLFESSNGTEGWGLSLCGEDMIVHDAFHTVCKELFLNEILIKAIFYSGCFVSASHGIHNSGLCIS